MKDGFELSRRILFLTTVSLNEESGGQIYSRSIRDVLSTLGDVTTVSLSEFQYHNTRWRRWFFAASRSLISAVPPNVLFHSGKLTSDAKNLINQFWDLVVIDHLESAYAYLGTDTKLIYLSHNRESELIPQKIPGAPKFLQNFLSSWVDLYEKKFVRLVNAVVTISSDEALWYKKFNLRTTVLPPVFDPVVSPPIQAVQDRLRVGFLGGSKWLPNRCAMDLLLTQILPHTQRRLELVIAGSGWDVGFLQEFISKAASKDRIILRYLGYVEHISDFWAIIDVFVAPILNGAGVNVKVCEALSNARPVIALPHAMRGLDGIDQNLVTCVSTPIEFARVIDSLDPSTFFYSRPIHFTPAYAASKLSELLSTIFGEISL